MRAPSISGQADLFEQNFPTRLTQPVALYTLGVYGQDEWKVNPKLTLVFGIRLEHNSNPTCLTNCFSVLSSDFSSLPTATTTPYSSLINSGQNKSFKDFQKVSYEPRVGFSYGLFQHTQVRGGFGFFSDSFPAQITDNLLNNAPTNVPVALGAFAGGTDAALYPGAANSFASQAAASNQAFQSGFHANGSNMSLSTIPGFSAPNFVNAAKSIKYPTYEEYSLQIQQQVTRSTALNIAYNGNHGYHEPVLNNSANAYNASGSGFASLGATAPNPNFAGVTSIYTGASSNYNGVVVSVINRTKMLTAQINYSYSHALDEISNGGFNGFSGNSVFPSSPGTLRQNYGNADYDTRNYFSGNYVFNLPYYGGPHLLTDGWQITGDAFHSSGLPFTFTDSFTATASLANYDYSDGTVGASLFAKQTVAHLPNKCSGNGATYGVNCKVSLDFAPATDFGQQARNQVFGPSYTDADLTISKGFSLHKVDEGATLRLGVQMFNVLNHPNFGQPNHDLSSCYDSNTGAFIGCAGTSVGTITSTVNPPTSILGSFLGGDASPRLIQLKAKFSF